MKKRLAKKIEKMRRKKIHEALEMVLEINTTQVRSQELTGRKPTAFFSFSGHVADVDVIVYQNGWSFTRGAEGRWSAQALLDQAGDMERSALTFCANTEQKRFILNQFQTPKQAEAFIILILNLKIRAELEIVATKLASEL